MIGLTLPQCLQAFYILSAASILLISSIPLLSSRFLPYGKTAIPPTKDEQSKESVATKASPLNSILRRIASYQVPHSYFNHFYIISVISSLFWGIQIATQGSVLQSILNSTHISDQPLKQSIDRVYLAWFCLLAQGIRRYYETVYVSKGSQSKMWVGHYLIGILYYAATGVAVWAEGAESLRNHQFNFAKVSPMIAPSFRTMLVLPIFILASGLQNDCHVYLASLEKYTLPQAALFQYIICPHYFAECIIYLALALLAAPNGQIINKTVFSADIFVMIILGISAKTNEKWYREKFGKDSVKGRWKMIPFVY